MTARRYRVVEAFGSVGADGPRRFEVGEIVTMSRPPKSARHFELVADAVGTEPDAPAAAPAEAPAEAAPAEPKARRGRG